MENFESLNAIVDEFKIKQSTLSIFCINSSYRLGKELKVVSSPPKHSLSDRPIEITFDSKDDAFCSIFLDCFQNSNTSSLSCPNTEMQGQKLKFESDMLSSDFDDDFLQAILTSSNSER